MLKKRVRVPTQISLLLISLSPFNFQEKILFLTVTMEKNEIRYIDCVVVSIYTVWIVLILW